MSEENESPAVEPVVTSVQLPAPVSQLEVISLSTEEHDALWQLLDRDRTAKESHGGLRGLLSLKENDYEALMALLNRVAAL
jgi:hypothetical protein